MQKYGKKRVYEVDKVDMVYKVYKVDKLVTIFKMGNSNGIMEHLNNGLTNSYLIVYHYSSTPIIPYSNIPNGHFSIST